MEVEVDAVIQRSQPLEALVGRDAVVQHTLPPGLSEANQIN